MLAIAVLACIFLQDSEVETGGSRLEVSGKIEGLTVYQDPASARSSAPSLEVPASKDEERRADERNEKAAPTAEPMASSKADASSRELESAKVKVLALAKAAAEKRQIPAQTSEKLAAPATAAPAGELADASAPDGASSAPKVVSVPVKPAPEKTPAKSAPEAASAPAVLKKFEGARIEVDPVAARSAALKAEARKSAVVKKAPAPKLSAVESALADARAGRLAPEKSASAAEKPAARYDRVVTSAKFAMQGSLIKLVLKGNAPMVGHYYVLEAPDRVVLDLAGNWQIEIPKVPSNRLIASVRVGQHEDKTRLVFDMKTTGKVALVPLNRNALELHIR